MYSLKINFIMPHRGNNFKNGNLSSREIANFCKIAKMYIYTCENIYVHSILQKTSIETSIGMSGGPVNLHRVDNITAYDGQ